MNVQRCLSFVRASSLDHGLCHMPAAGADSVSRDGTKFSKRSWRGGVSQAGGPVEHVNRDIATRGLQSQGRVLIDDCARRLARSIGVRV